MTFDAYHNLANYSTFGASRRTFLFVSLIVFQWSCRQGAAFHPIGSSHTGIKLFTKLRSPSYATSFSLRSLASPNQNSVAPPATGVENSELPSPHIRLNMLSLNPLLFESSEPILSENQCQILSSWARSQSQLDNGTFQMALERGEEGALLLKYVQLMLDTVLGISHEDEPVMPRYLSYSTSNDDDDGQNRPLSVKDYDAHHLLPDGLHVDTNNGKHLRHWTILLYLNSCETLGATTFPLARSLSEDVAHSSTFDDVCTAARKLIDENIYHTVQVEANESQLMSGNLLTKAALTILKNQEGNDEEKIHGVRVMPQQGKFCLFSGLRTDGLPNPYSFHGGEAMFQNEQKEVLSFFYEVPANGIKTREDLGKMVKQREDIFLNRNGIACGMNQLNF